MDCVTTSQICQECLEVEKILAINMVAVLEQLAQIKRSPLTKRERVYFCLSLRGYCSYAIAFRLQKNRLPEQQEIEKKDLEIKKKSDNLRSDMAKTIHVYIQEMMGNVVGDTRKPQWIRILNFLRENGFAKPDLLKPDAKEWFYLEIPIGNELEIQQQLEQQLEQLQQQLGDRIGFSIKVTKLEPCGE